MSRRRPCFDDGRVLPVPGQESVCSPSRGYLGAPVSARICILSSVHLAHDVRLFQAEARTLARAGFDVTVIALEDPTPSQTDGVVVQMLPQPRGKLRRMLGVPRFLWRAWRQEADLYAIHDPELVPVVAALRLLTRRPVVYDVHEDVPASIRNRAYLPAGLRPILAAAYRLLERLALPLISGLTLADESYARLYRGRHTLVALNYPLTTYADLYRPRIRRPESRPILVYTGSVTRLRGLDEMLDLVRRLRRAHPDLLLRIVGPLGAEESWPRIESLLDAHGIRRNVEFTGLVSHADVHGHILDADIGLALLPPDPNYLGSLPTKMFEYMMMGRPVVVSDFPLWQRIVEESGCGLAIDPLDGDAVADAVERLLGDEGLRAQMGSRGRDAVLEKYNWDAEGEKLVAFYRELLADASTAPPQA